MPIKSPLVNLEMVPVESAASNFVTGLSWRGKARRGKDRTVEHFKLLRLQPIGGNRCNSESYKKCLYLPLNQRIQVSYHKIFTDNQSINEVKPTELDWMVGLVFDGRTRKSPCTMKKTTFLDRSGLIQKYIGVRFRFSFDVFKRHLRIGDKKPGA